MQNAPAILSTYIQLPSVFMTFVLSTFPLNTGFNVLYFPLNTGFNVLYFQMGFSASVSSDNKDFESIVLMRMRQAEERKRLIEQMEKEDGEKT